MASETYQWRVTFENRTEHVYGSTIEEALSVACDRVRGEDGDLKTVELYTHGDGWGMCYVASTGGK